MEAEHKDRIRKNLTFLVGNTKLEDALEVALIQGQVFTPNMLQEVRAAGPGATRKLYLDVQRRGPKAFHILVAALQESGNSKAAQVLDPSLEPVEVSRPEKVWNPPTYLEEAPYIPPPPLELGTMPLNVKVTKATDNRQTVRDPVLCYPMRSSPRGLALIIDNENFQGEVLPTRTGSLVDANNLDLLFEGLGFKVTLRRNLGYHDMYSEVQKFAGREEHARADMAVLVVLSHGRHGLVAAADGRELETEWILKQLNNTGCPLLRGKPKLVLLQACRGDEADYGVQPPSLELGEGRTQSDARKIAPVAQEQYREVSWEDMIVAYSTLPGYVANRDR